MLRFIHVGKCAGTSVGKFLLAEGIPFHEYHCFDADQDISELLLLNSPEDSYLLTVRDPIKRYVSAFYWDLFEKRMQDDLHGPDNFWSRIYDEFKTPNALAEALTSSRPEIKELAEAAFSKSKLHMELSLAWYIRPDLARLLTKDNTFVIRTEHADEDMRGYISSFHARDVDVRMAREKSDYRSNIPGYDDRLSDLAISNLMQIYRNDYIVLEVLVGSGLIPSGYLGLPPK